MFLNEIIRYEMVRTEYGNTGFKYPFEIEIDELTEKFFIMIDPPCVCRGYVVPYKNRFKSVKDIDIAVNIINSATEMMDIADNNLFEEFNSKQIIEIEKRIKPSEVSAKIFLSNNLCESIDKTDILEKYLKLFKHDRAALNGLIEFLNNFNKNLFNKEKIKKLIENEGFTELLAVFKIPSIMKTLTVDDIIKLLRKLNHATNIIFASIPEKYRGDKNIAIEFARMGQFIKWQYIDIDVIKMYASNDSLSAVPKKILKKYKILEYGARLTGKVNELKDFLEKSEDKSKLCIWTSNIIAYGDKSKYCLIDILLKKIAKYGRKCSYTCTKEKVIESANEFPYLIWFAPYDNKNMKYYFMNEAYKHINAMAFNTNKYPLTIVKEIYRRLNKIPRGIILDFHDEEVIKFIFMAYDNNPSDIKQYIMQGNVWQELDLQRIYYPIVAGIMRMKRIHLEKEIEKQMKYFIFDRKRKRD